MNGQYLRLVCALWRFLFVFVLACRLRWPFHTRTSVPRWLPHPAHGSDRFPHPAPRGTPTPPPPYWDPPNMSRKVALSFEVPYVPGHRENKFIDILVRMELEFKLPESFTNR